MYKENGEVRCECGGRRFSMGVSGALDFSLRVDDDGSIVMDDAGFNYCSGEPTEDVWYCADCGKEYDRAKELFDGNYKEE